MKRLDIEFIRNEFEEEGYSLLSKTYKNNRQKLDFICPKGHKHNIRWSCWSRGRRCKKCASEKLGVFLRKDFYLIKKSVEGEGYTFLLKKEDYISSKKSRLIVKCPKGHIYKVTYSLWQKGCRCPICNINSRRLDIEFIRREFEKEGYTLLSKNYKNNSQKLKFKCPNNHIYFITYGHWSSGRRCGICSGNKKLEVQDVKSRIESEGYKLISKDYTSNKSRIRLLCPNNHEFKIRLDMWTRGSRCPICFKSKSISEKEVVSFLSDYISPISENDKNLIYPYELDIIIPSSTTAIEYCGLYWHSELQGKDRNYHLNKLNSCKEKGYKLITIFEDEWLYKNEIVKSRLLNILGLSNLERIFARKCRIQEINPQVKNAFLNRNHLQGQDRSSIKLGAYYNNKLVSVMTFSKLNLSKGSKHKENFYELNRYCSDYNYSVVGIASKLFKYFIDNYKPIEIITYGDKRWSDGALYKNLGFEYCYDSAPNYWYILTNKRFHRFVYRKSELKNKLEKFDNNISEWENMKMNGFNRIWDCGNTKWKWMKYET